MKNKICIWALIIWTMSVGPLGYSQTEAPLVRSVDIAVSTAKMKEDGRGTNVDNIYTFTVEDPGKTAAGQTFNILYYLDDRYVEEFKSQTLPFSFTRNFKGQPDRAHDIRIDIEDQDLRIVGRQTVKINVSHVKAR